jgi:hypothetical protein
VIHHTFFATTGGGAFFTVTFATLRSAVFVSIALIRRTLNAAG